MAGDGLVNAGMACQFLIAGIGDIVAFDKVSGLVENITLRKTTLRDMDGTVHHIPHGEVKTVSNYSKDFSRINLNVSIAYNSDLEKVIVCKVYCNTRKESKIVDTLLTSDYKYHIIETN